jgi:hypothetical protein
MGIRVIGVKHGMAGLWRGRKRAQDHRQMNAPEEI